ncbi:preprotein translocase subunit YajC [Aquipuribacter hungaricus]|uniref:Preprotein translocase subunit YajC n=1 Tax=Aquipuribacter hungaricus TaxID=545624 RepID=A0ABV7WCB1_9MICO
MDPAVLLVAGLVLILVLQFSRVRRQQREARDTRSALAVGAEVLTAAGMVGTVVETSGTSVVLAGEDGQRSRWLAAAVVRVLSDTDPASSRYVDPASPATSGDADVADVAGHGAVDLGKRRPDGATPGSTTPGTQTPGTTDGRGDDAPGTTGSTRQD